MAFLWSRFAFVVSLDFPHINMSGPLLMMAAAASPFMAGSPSLSLSLSPLLGPSSVMGTPSLFAALEDRLAPAAFLPGGGSLAQSKPDLSAATDKGPSMSPSLAPAGAGRRSSLAGLRLPPLPRSVGMAPVPGPWMRSALGAPPPSTSIVKAETVPGATLDAEPDAAKRFRTAAAPSIVSVSAAQIKAEGRVRGPRTRGRGPASEEASEQNRQRRADAKRQKALERATEKRERALRRYRKHMLNLGLKPDPSDMAAFDANGNLPEDTQATADNTNGGDVVDLSILPVGHNIPLEPLKIPCDAFSFDGRFGISILCTDTGRRDVPTICRFNFAPADDAPVLIGAEGIADAAEAFLYPSLCAAAKRANLKPGKNCLHIHLV